MNYEEEINRLKQDISALKNGGVGWSRFPALNTNPTFRDSINLTDSSGLILTLAPNILADRTILFPDADGILMLKTQYPRWIYPNHDDWAGTANLPLTSASWTGDAYSTTAKTEIDLNTVFGVPVGAKAVLLHAAARDSGSASGSCYIGFAPNDSAGVFAMAVKVYDTANDNYIHQTSEVPCDANGNIYYQCAATGVDTLDVILEIWGYAI